MPARSERITIVPGKKGQAIQTLSLPLWWDRGAFFEKYKEREICLGNPVDANYAWLLSATEAAVWGERSKREFSRDPRAGDGDPNVIDEMRQRESALSQAAWIRFESYEWESGLD
jgi:hypothetical protein